MINLEKLNIEKYIKNLDWKTPIPYLLLGGIILLFALFIYVVYKILIFIIIVAVVFLIISIVKYKKGG